MKDSQHLKDGPTATDDQARSMPDPGLPERLAWLPAPALLLAIVSLWALDLPDSYESPYLLLLLNFLFSTLVSAIVCFRIGRGFLAQGQPGLLMLGCGALLWGAAGLGSSIVGLCLSGSGQALVNTLLTIHNTCLWASATCHLAGAALLLKPMQPLSSPRILLASAYAGALLLVLCIALTALTGWLPPFFAPGLGGTLVRQFVLGSAIAMFVLAALLMRSLNQRRASSFAHWYALALLLLAAGLLGTWLQKANGGALGWAGRATQYLGGVYLLMAAAGSAREPHLEGAPLEQTLAEARRQFGLAVSVAVVSVSFAAATRLLFLQSLGLQVPYVTFFPSVMIAAVFGGFWSGMTATALSAALVLFYWTEPVGLLTLGNTAASLGMAIFIVNGMIISWIVSKLHRANARAIVAETEAKFAVERQRAAEALRESEERFRELFAKSPLGIALVDSLSRRVYEANPRFAEILGRNFQQMAELDWAKITHPDDLEESFRKLALLNSGEIDGYTMNKRYARPDGSIVWANVYVARLASRVGANPRHVCTIEDITERKKTEDALRKYAMAVEQSPVTIMITDTEGGIEFVNPMFTRLTGYSKEEVLGKNPRLLKSDNLDAVAYKGMWETISSGKVWEGDFHNKMKSGELFWEHVKISPIRSDDGVVTNFLAIKENISQRKKAEDLLCQSEVRFRQLFNQSNDAIVILDAGSCSILDCNSEMEKILGYRRAELVGEKISPLMENLDPPFADAARSPEGNYGQIEKIAMLKKDGSSLLVSVRFKVITLNAVEVFYCSFRDITERIRLEDEALTAQANLIQADKMASLGLLVSGMAHEINNPNNCILFNAELLARTWTSAMPILEEFHRENGDFKLGSFKFSESRDIIPRLFAGMVDGAERIRSIVDMLKDFARQDNGDTCAAFDVNKVLANAIALVNHEIKKRCNHFYLHAGRDVPPALGNAQQIEQVMINLIMNSLQSLRDVDGAIRIDVSLAPDGERVVVTVVDEGEGMSAEVLKRLSEPFFTTRSDSGGTGLGLSISTSILQKNQATISFASAPGKGTTARVELRVCAGQNGR